MSSAPRLASKPRPFVSWVRRYEHVFILLGAVIVFATYLVKDLLREDLKDLVDSIEIAKHSFKIRGDLVFASSEILTLEDQVADLKVAVNQGKPDHLDDYSDEITGDLSILKEQLFAGLYSLGNTLDLLKQLPHQEEKVKSVNELRLSILRTMDEEEKFATAFNEGKKPNSEKIADEARALRNKGCGFCVLCMDAANDAIKQAEAIKAEKEHTYRTWRLLSYWLYGFGWALGLLSALCGMKKFNVSEVAEA
jgi:hypothetical protein